MLLLIRHGQASFGAAQYDRLSPLGVEQAQVTGAYLRTREALFHSVSVGPRVRHRDTAVELLAAWEVRPPLRHENDLDEFTGGEQVLDTPDATAPDRATSTVVTSARIHRLGDRIDAWAQGKLVLPDGLTMTQFRLRIGHWLRRELEGDSGSTIKISVTSGGVIAAAICEVMNLPDTMFLSVVSQIRNASLTEFCLCRQLPVLHSFNGTAHLPERLSSWI